MQAPPIHASTHHLWHSITGACLVHNGVSCRLPRAVDGRPLDKRPGLVAAPCALRRQLARGARQVTRLSSWPRPPPPATRCRGSAASQTTRPWWRRPGTWCGAGSRQTQRERPCRRRCSSCVFCVRVREAAMCKCAGRSEPGKPGKITIKMQPKPGQSSVKPRSNAPVVGLVEAAKSAQGRVPRRPVAQLA